jgi:hypothetical protein
LLTLRVRILRESLRRHALDFIDDGIHIGLFDLWLIGQNIARIVWHGRAGLNILQQLVERFSFVGQLHIGVVRVRLTAGFIWSMLALSSGFGSRSTFFTLKVGVCRLSTIAAAG